MSQPKGPPQNARVLFLKAIENKTPEVLNSLRHEVWHLYEAVYWQVSPQQSEEDWRYTIHPGLVCDWLANRTPTGWTSRARVKLTRLKKALFAWAEKYCILKDWIIRYALDAMMFWAAYQSSPDRIREERRLHRLIGKDIGGTPGRSPSCKVRHFWGIGTGWYFDQCTQRQFTYPNWQGEDVDQYYDSVQSAFEGHLKSYMSEIQNRANALPRIPKASHPELFGLLALYHCRKMSPPAAGKQLGIHKHSTVILKYIQGGNRLIGLDSHSPGRPKKPCKVPL